MKRRSNGIIQTLSFLVVLSVITSVVLPPVISANADEISIEAESLTDEQAVSLDEQTSDDQSVELVADEIDVASEIVSTQQTDTNSEQTVVEPVSVDPTDIDTQADTTLEEPEVANIIPTAQDEPSDVTSDIQAEEPYEVVSEMPAVESTSDQSVREEQIDVTIEETSIDEIETIPDDLINNKKTARLTSVSSTNASYTILNNGLEGISIDINAWPYIDSNYNVGNAYTDEGCTWFACSRIVQLTGRKNIPCNQGPWYYNHMSESQYGGYKTAAPNTDINTINAPAILCWEKNSDGKTHVAILEKKLPDGTLLISQGGDTKSDAAHGYTSIRKYTYNQMTGINTGPFKGYVLLNGTTVAVTGVSLNKTNTTINLNQTETLIATVSPANATNKTITWSTSNPNVAEIDTTGTVRPKSAGTTVITVKSADGGFVANCTVTIKNPTTEKSAKVLGLPEVVYLNPNESKTITCTIETTNVDINSLWIGYNSSNINVFGVVGGSIISEGNKKSFMIRARGNGEAVLTVYFDGYGGNDNFKTGTCHVIVGEKGGSSILNGWNTENGKQYWYENGVKQGTYSDSKGVVGDGTIRGREIYDPKSDAWYWLDAVYGGAKAVGKEVWMPYIYQDEDKWSTSEKWRIAQESDPGMADCVYNAMISKAGKWVRYDQSGRMLKGWVTINGELARLYPNQAGNTYYYDHRTGLMAKGWVKIDGKSYHFDEVTGVLKR